jgi:hypothetical protein
VCSSFYDVDEREEEEATAACGEAALNKNDDESRGEDAATLSTNA